MEKKHLHLLINEEIYVIDETQSHQQLSESGLQNGENSLNPGGKISTTDVHQSPKDDKGMTKPESHSKTSAIDSSTDDSGLIGNKKDLPTADTPSMEVIEKVQIAFIHDSNKAEELALLDKIVAACKLEASIFKILRHGEKIEYEKGILFTESTSSFYQATESGHTQILYSRPLHVLMSSKEEKGKLWNALKEFVQ